MAQRSAGNAGTGSVPSGTQADRLAELHYQILDQ